MNLKQIINKEKYFIRATGTRQDPSEIIGKGNSENIGTIGYNNGVIAFVDENRDIYVGLGTNKAFEALTNAGYKHKGLSVPHSSDGGYFVREALRLRGTTLNLLNKYNIDEESYTAIEESIRDINLSNLNKLDIVSFNRVFEAKDKETGEDLIIKLSGNKNLSKIEAASNYFLSQNDKLSNIITKGYYAEPIENGNLYITVQKKEKDNEKYDAHYYMASLALLYCYGKEILAKNDILIPEYEIKSFEKILEEISKKENSNNYKHLKNLYGETLDKLNEIKENGVIQSDNKKDNFDKGKVLDLEGLRIGKIPIGISLYLVQSELPIETWKNYVKTFLDVTQQETGKPYTPNDLINLTEFVKDAAVPTTIKELAGLYSRKMNEKQEKQVNVIKNFLTAAA